MDIFHDGKAACFDPTVTTSQPFNAISYHTAAMRTLGRSLVRLKDQDSVIQGRFITGNQQSKTPSIITYRKATNTMKFVRAALPSMQHDRLRGRTFH